MGLGNCSISEIIKVTPNKTYTCQYTESVDSSIANKINVTMYFASLKFTAYYFANDKYWYHFTDAFVINWYENEPNYQYSAD